MKTLVVLGAPGTMGRRVVALARRELEGVEVLAASRRGTAVGDARGLALDLHDRAGLERALARGDCTVVNTVGPFDYDPTPLVSACVASGSHYVDLAETPAFLAAVARAAREAGAAERGVVLVPGASTTPGLVELLAQAWAERPEVTGVDAWLSLGSRNPLGTGMLLGLLRPLGRDDDAGARWFRGTVTRPGGDGRRYGRYPAGFPAEGLRLGPRSVPVRFFVGFDRALLVRGLSAAAPALAALPDRALARVARVALPAARAVSRLGTPRGSLVLEALGAPGARVEVVAEREGLDVPAAPALWVASTLQRGHVRARGCVALRDVVPLAEAAARLRGAGRVVRGIEP